MEKRTTIDETLLTEKMPHCKKHENMKIIFVCQKQDCPDIDHQYYCLTCLKIYHDHRPIAIADAIDEIFVSWKSLYEEYISLMDVA